MRIEITRMDDLPLHSLLEETLRTQEKVKFFTDFSAERIRFEVTKGELTYRLRLPSLWISVLHSVTNTIIEVREGPLALAAPMSEIATYWISRIKELEEAEKPF